MTRKLIAVACLLVASCFAFAQSGIGWHHSLLMLPRPATAQAQYQTDPYADSIIARWDFDNDAAWTNDVGTNGFNMGIVGSGASVSNFVVGTNAYGRQEKAAYFSSAKWLRTLIPQSSFPAWSNSETVTSYWIYHGRSNVLTYVYGFGSTNIFDDGVFHNISANNYKLNVAIRSNAVSQGSDGTPLAPQANITNGVWNHVVELRSVSKGSMVWVNGTACMTASKSTSFRWYTFADVISREVSAGRNTALHLGNCYVSQPMLGYLDNVKVYSGINATSNIPWLLANTNPTNCLESR